MTSINVRSDADLYVFNILQQLNCPLVGNGEDWWMNELLFRPGNHRFQLFEWIFTKFRFHEITEIQSTDDGKDYLKMLCAMGLCEKSDSKFLTGDLIKSKQLKFWKVLLDMLLIHTQTDAEVLTAEVNTQNNHLSDQQSYVINHDNQTKDSSSTEKQSSVGDSICKENVSNEADNKLPENSENGVFSASKQLKCFDTEYQKCTSIINKVASNLQVHDLFCEKTTVFPPDIEKDIRHILSSNKEIVKELPSTKELISKNESSDKIHTSIIPTSSSIGLDATSECDNQSSIEYDKTVIASDFQDMEKQFTGAYSELKPVLQSSNTNSSDFGSEFKEVHPQMELFAKVMSYLNMTKGIGLMLGKDFSNSDFGLDDLSLTGSDLENYITVVQANLPKVPKEC